MMRRNGHPLRRRGLSGQSVVEFALVSVAFFAVLLGAISLSLSAWMASEVDFRSSELASELPAGWDSMDDKELVKTLMTSGTGLDPDRITVRSAHVEERQFSNNNSMDDPLANRVGADVAHEDAAYLWVRAQVTYDTHLPGTFLASGPGNYTRNIERIYVVNRRYEVS